METFRWLMGGIREVMSRRRDRRGADDESRRARKYENTKRGRASAPGGDLRSRGPRNPSGARDPRHEQGVVCCRGREKAGARDRTRIRKWECLTVEEADGSREDLWREVRLCGGVWERVVMRAHAPAGTPHPGPLPVGEGARDRDHSGPRGPIPSSQTGSHGQMTGRAGGGGD